MDDVRVSTIELFFDLVFVFTITQLTSVLVAEPTGAGLARVALIFGNVWWIEHEPVLLDRGEVLDETEKVRTGRYAGCPLLLVGQPLGHAHHRVAILVEVVEEHVALRPDEVGRSVVRHRRRT
jgi:hypothetical protein